MNKNVRLKSICADCSGKINHVFDIKHDPHDYDCHDTCLLWDRITFYGVPEGLADKQWDGIYNGNYEDAIKIGSVLGCIILCREIIRQGEDPWLVSEDENGDLEYTMSALTDEDGPLNDDTGDPYQNVYYIHELEMEPGYDTKTLKRRILKELPKLIFSFFHIRVGVLASYPVPQEYELNVVEEERTMTLRTIAAGKMEDRFGSIMSPEARSSNVLSFNSAYRFTEDELKRVMGQRNSTSRYPEEAKNKEEWALFESVGFKEAGESQLLYKEIRK